MNDNVNYSSRSKFIRMFLAIAVAIGVVYFAYYLIVARWLLETDDAYAVTDVVTITSEVPGTVHTVHVDDTETVKAGQVLVELDSRDADMELAAAEAQLAHAVRNVHSIEEQVIASDNEANLRKVELARLEQDLNRRQPLRSDGAVANEELTHLSQSVDAARKALAASEAKTASLRAMLNKGDLSAQPEVAQAIAHVRMASLAHERTKIVAPIDGVIAKRSVQVGARLMPGAPLMAVVPLNQVWVDANYREVDLKHVRIGQPAELTADLYGSDVVYKGHVAGLSAGTGSAFSLLPAQNASGNWIKIVQRVPVRVVLDHPEELQSHPLRIGLSMRVKIDTHDQTGSLVTTDARGTLARPETVVNNDAKVEARIQAIIHANQAP